jgi:hypothetical protein
MDDVDVNLKKTLTRAQEYLKYKNEKRHPAVLNNKNQQAPPPNAGKGNPNQIQK